MKKGFIGHCEVCGKDMYDIPMGDTYFIDGGSVAFIYLDTVIIESNFGSAHDMSISYIVDKELFRKIYSNIKNGFCSNYYICDECLEDDTKFTTVKNENVCNINPDEKYVPISRKGTPIFGHLSEMEIMKNLKNFSFFSLPSHPIRFSIIKSDDNYIISLIQNEKIEDIHLPFDSTLLFFNDMSYIILKTNLFKSLYIPVV